MKKVHVFEDDENVRLGLVEHFRQVLPGWSIHEYEAPEKIMQAFEMSKSADAWRGDIVVLDLKVEGRSGYPGYDVLEHLCAWTDHHRMIKMVITAYSENQTINEALRHRIDCFLQKPVSRQDIELAINSYVEPILREIAEIGGRISRIAGLVGSSSAMELVRNTISEVGATSSVTVFIRSETGTGKDLIAKAIHYNSERAARPFMNITCTAISETLLESELFGHEKGAFTDAKQTKKGLLELADGGTVFLDEVGDMPPQLQAKLLRFLEEKSFRRVGGVKDVEVDVRIIAATHCDVEKLIEEGKFRKDLFYRLNVFPMKAPPLRERLEDLSELLNHFMDKARQDQKLGSLPAYRGIEKDALAELQRHSWPGNVRELENLADRLVVKLAADRTYDGTLKSQHITAASFRPAPGQPANEASQKTINMSAHLGADSGEMNEGGVPVQDQSAQEALRLQILELGLPLDIATGTMALPELTRWAIAKVQEAWVSGKQLSEVIPRIVPPGSKRRLNAVVALIPLDRLRGLYTKEAQKNMRSKLYFDLGVKPRECVIQGGPNSGQTRKRVLPEEGGKRVLEYLLAEDEPVNSTDDADEAGQA